MTRNNIFICLHKIKSSKHYASKVKEKVPSGAKMMHSSEGSDSSNMTLVLTGYGGYDKMKVQNKERPKRPGRLELLLNIRASGINFAELMCRQGTYDRTPKTPAVLGLEGSGEVLMVGDDVKNFKVGDRVICVQNFGLWTEYACVEAETCFVMPEGMTYEEGAAIPVNYVTAHHMLFDFGNLRKGKSVLIHMAAGGVGTAATQLCKTVPNVTVFGTASASKHEAIRKLGVDYPIDYRTQDYVTEIHKIDPNGVDIVLDPLSGVDSEKGYNLLKPLGKIIHFGAANVVTGQRRSLWGLVSTYMQTKSHCAINMISDNRGMCGYHMGHLVDTPQGKALIRSAMGELIDLYREGKFKPQIDSVWSYHDVGQAMARMHNRENIGKVILSPQALQKEGKNIDM